jgi:hypothetical protein
MKKLKKIRPLSFGIFAVALVLFVATLSNAADEVSPREQPPPSSGDVQERGLQRRPLGGTTTGPLREIGPVGFTCDAKTRTCSCRLSKTGDCDLMKAVACGSDFNCPGSSQTCTCKALR